MFEDTDNVDDTRGARRQTSPSRMRAPRAARTSRRPKKRGGSFGGKHQRRNKHWSW
jgi:hypothetical protein